MGAASERLARCAAPPQMRVSYARVYRRAQATGRDGVAAWIRAELRRPRRPAARLAWAKHLRTLVTTQALCEDVDAPTRALVNAEGRLAHLAAVARLRVLQRHIVRHLWRPGGPMARKCEAHFAALW